MFQREAYSDSLDKIESPRYDITFSSLFLVSSQKSSLIFLLPARPGLGFFLFFGMGRLCCKKMMKEKKTGTLQKPWSSHIYDWHEKTSYGTLKKRVKNTWFRRKIL